MERELINLLGFEGVLIDIDTVANKYPDYADICKIGVSKVYFVAGRPAVLFLEVRDFDTNTLKKIASVQHSAWNYQRVMLLYVYSDVEIRVYNCFALPVISKSDSDIKIKLNSLQLAEGRVGENLDMLANLFSRINVDSGTLWTTDNLAVRNKIVLEERVDAYLIECMGEASKILRESGLSLDIVHSLLIRSLFILFLEDRGSASDAGLYDGIKKGAVSYFDILDDKEATYCLYRRLHDQFNGNITMLSEHEEAQVLVEHLAVIKDCFWRGDFRHETLFNERLFDFKIIHIGLISEIYQNFLGELRDEKGQFYTPFVLADMMLTEVLPTSSKEYSYPILDPACGSGIFLVEGYKRLIMRWKNTHPGQTPSFDILVSLLRDNVFGIEIDPTAIRVAAFSLYLTLIDQLDPKTLWNSTNHHLPYLIYDPEDATLEGRQGRNLLRRNTISEVNNDHFSEIKLVVGNPPYGTKKLSSEIKEYCKQQGFAAEYVLPFMHKSAQFAPNGDIALVFTAKVLFNTNGGYARFRNWLFTENTVKRLDNLSIFRNTPKSFGGSLFADATCPVCVVYYKHGVPDQDHLIKYYAPKTFIKSSLVDALVIDETDVKMLPVAECQRSDSKIWKVASWGNFYGYQLIKRLSKNSLKKYFASNGWIYGRGLNADAEHPDFIPSPIIKSSSIARYWSDCSSAIINEQKKYRKVSEGLFYPPYVVFKQGQHNGEIVCSLFQDRVYVTSTAYIFNGGTLEEKKVLTAYLNSRLVKYFLFMTSSSWGVEREQLLTNEVLDLPSPFNMLKDDAKERIVSWFDELYRLSSVIPYDEKQISQLEESIEKEFEILFGLTERDITYVHDTLDCNLDLFQNKLSAFGYRRVLDNESLSYGSTLISSLDSQLTYVEMPVKVTIFNPEVNDPLQMVILYLDVEDSGICKGELAEYRTALKRINNYLLSQHSDSVYLKKTIKFYDDNTIYIIKPNQKRFWSNMQAYEDAAAIVNDILNM